MDQKTASLFITKLRQRRDKNGVTYFIGNFGMATLMLRPHKTNADEWNMFLMEARKKEDGHSGFSTNHNTDSGFVDYVPPSFDSSDSIPF